MAQQNKKLRAFIRLDGKHRPVSGTTVLRLNKPKVGNWKEVLAYLCCTTTTTASVLSIQQVFKNTGYSSSSSSCADTSQTLTFYTTVPMVGPVFIGIVLYVDPMCTTPLGGSNLWWLHGVTGTAMLVQNNGVITDSTTCK